MNQISEERAARRYLRRGRRHGHTAVENLNIIYGRHFAIMPFCSCVLTEGQEFHLWFGGFVLLFPVQAFKFWCFFFLLSSFKKMIFLKIDLFSGMNEGIFSLFQIVILKSFFFQQRYMYSCMGMCTNIWILIVIICVDS